MNAATAAAPAQPPAKKARIAEDAIPPSTVVSADLNSKLLSRCGMKVVQYSPNLPQHFSVMRPTKYYPPKKLTKAPSFVSVKCNGNRAVWNGLQQTLTSKRGLVIKPPASWSSLMPKYLVLDGELVVFASDAREGTITEYKTDLHAISPIWSRKDGATHPIWGRMKFFVFDLLGCSEFLANPTFIRLRELQTTVQYLQGDVLRLVEHHTVTDAQLEAFKQYYKARGAEGVVVKDYMAPYKWNGNAAKQWGKIKNFEDLEAKVVHIMPSGGAKIKLPDGTIVYIQNESIHPHIKREDLMIKEEGKVVNVRHDGSTHSLRHQWDLVNPYIQAILEPQSSKEDIDELWANVQQDAPKNASAAPVAPVVAGVGAMSYLMREFQKLAESKQ